MNALLEIPHLVPHLTLPQLAEGLVNNIAKSLKREVRNFWMPKIKENLLVDVQDVFSHLQLRTKQSSLRTFSMLLEMPKNANVTVAEGWMYFDLLAQNLPSNTRTGDQSRLRDLQH